VRRTLDYHAHRALTSRQNPNETISQWGVRMDTVCGDLQRAARKHMEGLEWASKKCEGGSDIIDLFICACIIQGMHDYRIQTMVKAKGNVNTPMAQLVEVALEEESAIRSERFKRNVLVKGQHNCQWNSHVLQRQFERRDVRTAVVTCYRCNKKGNVARNCEDFPRADRVEQGARGPVGKGPGNSRNKSENFQRGAYQSNRR
jgi:hypothetical protein